MYRSCVCSLLHMHDTYGLHIPISIPYTRQNLIFIDWLIQCHDALSLPQLAKKKKNRDADPEVGWKSSADPLYTYK